jgi:hypothetical protein
MRDRRVLFGWGFSCRSSFSSSGAFGRVGVADGTVFAGSVERTRTRLVEGSPSDVSDSGSLDDRRV